MLVPEPLVEPRPAPPRNPVPSTLTVVEFRVSAPVTSNASTPPALPFHALAVSVEDRMALAYTGTRIT